MSPFFYELIVLLIYLLIAGVAVRLIMWLRELLLWGLILAHYGPKAWRQFKEDYNSTEDTGPKCKTYRGIKLR